MNRVTKYHRAVAILLAGSILTTSCVSSTTITSNPSGAKLYLNGENVGMTPYTHRDSKIVGSSNTVKIEKEGYQAVNTGFSRDEEVDVGAIIGGLFLLVPFLWTMKYKPSHSYELVPVSGSANPTTATSPITSLEKSGSKADRLRELKKLLDDKIITQEEYEKEKKKVLDSN